MKIALYHNLTSGGSKREAYEFTRRFIDAGHLVDLYAPCTADEAFLPLEEVVRRTYRFDIDLIPPISGRVPGIRKYLDLAALQINLNRIQALARKIAQTIDGEGYDFVFLHHDQIVQSPYLLRYLNWAQV